MALEVSSPLNSNVTFSQSPSPVEVDEKLLHLSLREALQPKPATHSGAPDLSQQVLMLPSKKPTNASACITNKLAHKAAAAAEMPKGVHLQQDPKTADVPPPECVQQQGQVEDGFKTPPSMRRTQPTSALMDLSCSEQLEPRRFFLSHHDAKPALISAFPCSQLRVRTDNTAASTISSLDHGSTSTDSPMADGQTPALQSRPALNDVTNVANLARATHATKESKKPQLRRSKRRSVAKENNTSTKRTKAATCSQSLHTHLRQSSTQDSLVDEGGAMNREVTSRDQQTSTDDMVSQALVMVEQGSEHSQSSSTQTEDLSDWTEPQSPRQSGFVPWNVMSTPRDLNSGAIKKLYCLESEIGLSTHFMRYQTTITEEDRANAINSFLRFYGRYAFRESTLHIAVAVADKTLQNHIVEREDLKPLLLVALKIAMSTTENQVFMPVSDIIRASCRLGFTKKLFYETERRVLHSLDYKTRIADVFTFLSWYFMSKMNKFEGHAPLAIEARHRFWHMANYIIDLSITSSTLVCVSPSIRAAAAMVLAATSLCLDTPFDWVEELSDECRVSLSSLNTVIGALNDILERAEDEPTVTSIYKKYSQPKQWRVAQISSAAPRPIR